MKTITHAIALLLTTSLVLGLSGCTSSKSEPQPEPSQSVVASNTQRAAPTTSQAPVKAGPGMAHNANYSFKPDESLPQASFSVNKSWTKLDFGVQVFKTAQCGVLQAEPPAGTGTGPQPAVTFTSPSGKKIGPLALGTYSSCDVNTNNKVGTTPQPSSAESEIGTWKVDVTGRGVNMYVQVSVLGS